MTCADMTFMASQVSVDGKPRVSAEKKISALHFLATAQFLAAMHSARISALRILMDCDALFLGKSALEAIHRCCHHCDIEAME